METDNQLLSAYVDEGTQAAFSTLVQRHLSLVFSAALRQVRDPARAEEVTQQVFSILAHKAKTLKTHPALIGWLFKTTAFVGSKTRAAEWRRSQSQTSLSLLEGRLATAHDQIPWEQTRPVIDQALLELREVDRTAILMRFFEGCQYSEIALQMGLAENAARMRVERALDRLRTTLARRGIVSTAIALGATLTSHATVPVPQGLATSVAAVAVSGAANITLSAAFMSSILTKTAILATTVVLLSGLLIEHAHIKRLEAENHDLSSSLAREARQVSSGIPSSHETKTQQSGMRLERIGSAQRQEIHTPPSGNLADNRDPSKGLTKLQYFQNVGRATPTDALQTIVWAATTGDKSLSDMLFLNRAARNKADEIISNMTGDEQLEYATPEGLAALYVSSELDGIKELQFANVRQVDFETYEIDVASGDGGSGTTTFSMQTTPTGWLLKIPAVRLARLVSGPTQH